MKIKSEEETKQKVNNLVNAQAKKKTNGFQRRKGLDL